MGYNALDKLDTIQHRAIRLYIDVHKFAPNRAIIADMGWQSSWTRRHVNMLRLWNRLLDMEPQRLTRNIFEWDKDYKRGWCKNVSEKLSTIRCSGFFDANWKVDLATSLLHYAQCEKRKVDVLNVPKLRTYVLFKNSYKLNLTYQSSVTDDIGQWWLSSDVVFYRFVRKLVGLCLSHRSTAFAYCVILTFYFIVNFTQPIGRTCSRMPNLKLVTFVRWIYKLNSKY